VFWLTVPSQWGDPGVTNKCLLVKGDAPMKPTRRDFLRTTALGAGAAVAAGILGRAGPLAAYGAVPNLAGKTAVVVGSGFAGAVAALRLGQAGVRTIVLERGRRWDVDDAGTTFCTINNPDGRAAWFSDHPNMGANKHVTIPRYAGLIDRVEGDGIGAITGVGVGGGSLVIGTFMPQPRRAGFQSVYPGGIDYDELNEVYWPRARRELGVSTIPDDILAHPQYKGARAWLDYVRAFGKEPERIPFLVDWDVIRAELAGQRPGGHSVGEGPYGSNSGSKNSVDRNYLRRATATGNVTILPLHEVTEIREVPGQSTFELRARQIDEHGTVLATKTFACDLLFMAAGSLFTTSLMVTAKAKGWLPRLSDQVGKGFGNNGDFLTMRISLTRDVGNKQGGPGVARFHDDANPFAPATMAWEAAPWPEWLGSTNMAHLVTSITAARGEIRYDAATGKGRIHWPYREMETSADKAGRDLVSRFWWQTEGRFGRLFNGLPVYDRGQDLGSRVTWHPLGGMVMGQACDLDGKAHGYDNLYVVDGALLPGSTCNANPSLTITAIAERCLDRFVATHT
jgi:cholesterol oxidase